MEIELKNVLETYKTKQKGMKALASHKSLFPLRTSPLLAGIVADLMGDGHLQGPGKWRVDYSSGSKEELERFNRKFNQVFSVSGSIRECVTNRYSQSFNLGINSRPISRVLWLCGVPYGSKVLKKFEIPQWIMNDKDCFRFFVRRLFDCEGCVDLYGAGAIELRMWKEQSIISSGVKFFEQIRKGLWQYFEITPTNVFKGRINIRKDGLITRCLRIKIKRKADILKYAKEIGFDTKIKSDKLLRLTKKEWARRDLNSRAIPLK